MRALAAAVLLLAVAPAAAGAYHLGGARWPRGVVTYHSSAPAYAKAIRAAVRSWNRSGARIRLRQASTARADLHIQYGLAQISGDAGRATLGWAPPGAVTFHLVGGLEVEGAPSVLCGRRFPVPGAAPGPRRQRMRCLRGPHMLLVRPAHRRPSGVEEETGREVVVTHEFGHVLGLNHNQPACSVMSYRRDRTCPRGKPWQIRCRLLERDDVRGAVRRYGGHARRLARPFCNRAPAPRPATSLTATRGRDGLIAVAWARSGGDIADRYRIAIGTTCPVTPPRRPGVALAGGSRQGDVLPDQPGPACVAVWHEDPYGRLAKPATAVVADAPNAAPTARFGVADGEVNRSIAFTDESSDPDGQVVAWAWAFGDGGTATDAAPTHTYAAPGTYTVTLTVTDDRGATATVRRPVVVTDRPDQPPEAAFSYEQQFGSRSVSFFDDSFDPDGSIAARRWTFGDGATSTQPAPAHGYAAAGSYSVTLTVTDDRGVARSAQEVVVVSDP